MIVTELPNGHVSVVLFQVEHFVYAGRGREKPRVVDRIDLVYRRNRRRFVAHGTFVSDRWRDTKCGILWQDIPYKVQQAFLSVIEDGEEFSQVG